MYCDLFEIRYLLLFMYNLINIVFIVKKKNNFYFE